MRYVVLDFESCSSRDLKGSGAAEYALDASTFLLSIGYKIIDDGLIHHTRIIYRDDCRQIDDELLELAQDPLTMFVCHNAGFEILMWAAHMVKIGYPPLNPERWHDTMAVAARKALPMGLEALCDALETPIRKDKEGYTIMMRMCKPNKDGTYNHS